MKYPGNVPEKFGKYEDMPTGAGNVHCPYEALPMGRHLGGVSQTFSKMTVTAADISALLQTVERIKHWSTRPTTATMSASHALQTGLLIRDDLALMSVDVPAWE